MKSCRKVIAVEIKTKQNKTASNQKKNLKLKKKSRHFMYILEKSIIKIEIVNRERKKIEGNKFEHKRKKTSGIGKRRCGYELYERCLDEP
ncbi:hypothetical protein DERP_005961 [Dermatophagoides pteronyssinus]|uniref:Uncharacterized protein n=1 Tax=Dermatophagoides pteronyssinus TaxID=6956 RepID=A0ABQ8JRY0_DERPT|nr:hypothetical protein DERP_005961 [Dermatophagoides pteronyssinus]